MGQSQGEEQVLSNERIPTELSSEGVFVQHWQEWDRESLPAQYLMELDDTALMLIEQVQNVCAQASPADLFDGIGTPASAPCCGWRWTKPPPSTSRFRLRGTRTAM